MRATAKAADEPKPLPTGICEEIDISKFGNSSSLKAFLNTSIVLFIKSFLIFTFEFLKSIWSLPITNYKIPPFFLIDSGRPNETTGEMVNSVRKVAADNPEEFEKVCNHQEKETKSLLLALKNGDKEMMKQAIRKGERNLEKIRVVGKNAKKIIGEIDKLDGAAKISGAGGLALGSGFLLCYHEDFSKLKEIEKSNGVVIQKVKLGGEGVRIEQCQK